MLVHIPHIIAHMKFVAEQENLKNNQKYDRYKYFLTGVKMDGQAFTVLSIIGKKQGLFYYDQSVLPNEKHELVEVVQKKKGQSGELDQQEAGSPDTDLSLPKYRKFLEIMGLAFGEN
jgi:hypothetical protein